MLQIRKNYHSLNELSSKWGLTEADLLYLADDGFLTVSVRVSGFYPRIPSRG
jgi:hypothetical protein